jgi:hypothetical protein
MTAAFFGPGNLRRWVRRMAYAWCAVSAAHKGVQYMHMLPSYLNFSLALGHE